MRLHLYAANKAENIDWLIHILHENSFKYIEMELGMEYIPPEIDSNYGSNNSIFTSPGMEDSVFKLSRIFLDHLFNGNLLPNNTIDQLIKDPDSASCIVCDDENE